MVTQINNETSTIWICDTEAEAEEYRLWMEFDEDYEDNGKIILIIYRENKK